MKIIYQSFTPVLIFFSIICVCPIFSSSDTVDAGESGKKWYPIILGRIEDGENFTRSTELPEAPEDGCEWIVYDLAGKSVFATEADGGQRVIWDGKTITGIFLPPGIYIAAIDQDGTPYRDSNDWTWTKFPYNPVMRSGCSGTWDSVSIVDPSYIDEGDTLKMWYSGYDGSGGPRSIGFSWSIDDGESWNCFGEAVLETGSGSDWDSDGIEAPYVMEDGSGYTMWYAGFDGVTLQIGRAESSDGITWVKDPGNPVLEAESGEWDVTIGYKAVIKEDSNYKMWYAGVDFEDDVLYKIGYATSPDGSNWTKWGGNPIIGEEQPPDWEETGMSTLDVGIRQDTKGSYYEMWYSGTALGISGPRLGSAVSADGLAWEKDAGNPFLELGAAGTYDASDLTSPSVEVYPDRLHLIYAARSDDDGMWEESFASAENKSETVENNEGGITAPVRQGLDNTYPNPFNPEITVRFTVPARLPAVLRICDLSGRLVKTLCNSTLDPGNYSVLWDGRNEDGRVVANGVYICSLEWSGLRDTAKIVLLK